MTTRSLEVERNAALLAWYTASGRDLPWRSTRDPYPVLVSEVMLQQTQAARVISHYELFMERFPSIEVLARASLREVLEAWSGLGYNARARRLRDAAQIIAHRGWPTTPEDLGKLPGVGPYTAAAVASLAFGARVVAIDTNVRRVLSRWHGEPLTGSAADTAGRLDLTEDAGTWNQAVMDLGASLCHARNPRCAECPVEQWCAGPDTYVPPPPQPRFEGSARQLRGSIVRAVLRQPRTLLELRAHSGFATDEIKMALEDLEAEGLIAQGADGRFRPAD